LLTPSVKCTKCKRDILSCVLLTLNTLYTKCMKCKQEERSLLQAAMATHERRTPLDPRSKL